VFGEPEWTPAWKHKARPRDPASLAPDRRDLTAVMTAVHEVADAVARMGSGDLDGVRAFQSAARLYISNRIMSDRYITHLFVPAPGDRVHLLKNAYYLCADASHQAAAALDSPAVEAGAPQQVSRPDARGIISRRACLLARARLRGPLQGFR
jgi:hypothetical protein